MTPADRLGYTPCPGCGGRRERSENSAALNGPVRCSDWFHATDEQLRDLIKNLLVEKEQLKADLAEQVAVKVAIGEELTKATDREAESNREFWRVTAERDKLREALRKIDVDIVGLHRFDADGLCTLCNNGHNDSIEPFCEACVAHNALAV